MGLLTSVLQQKTTGDEWMRQITRHGPHEKAFALPAGISAALRVGQSYRPIPPAHAVQPLHNSNRDLPGAQTRRQYQCNSPPPSPPNDLASFPHLLRRRAKMDFRVVFR